MIRKIEQRDRAVFLEMAGEFYSSDAVLHPIPEAHHGRTFDECLRDGPYAAAYILEEAEGVAGYALVSLAYSNEAGGLVLWLEELYIRPRFRGRGLGSAFFRFVEREYAGRVARLRLEADPGNAGAAALYKRLGFGELPYVQFVREMGG